MLKSALTSTLAFLGGLGLLGAVDYNSLEVEIAMNPGELRQLMERFQRADTTLTTSEVAYIYYGSSMTCGYDPDENGDTAMALAKEGSMCRAEKEISHALRQQPASLALLRRARCIARIANPVDSCPSPLLIHPETLEQRAEMVANAILESGRGTNPQSPFYVVSSSDIDVILNDFLRISHVTDRTRVGNVEAIKVVFPSLPAREHILYFDNSREEQFHAR